MPELPEVQALAEALTREAAGARLARIEVAAIPVLKTYDPPVTALVGQALQSVSRRGKFLDLSFDSLHLVIHLARAGWLRWREELPTAPARPGKGPLALRVGFESGAGFELTEAGTQKRLAVYVVPDSELVPGLASLGPEPLDAGFTVDAFAAILSGASGQLKGVLRNQSLIAGIGNAYSDEILHAARLSPYKPAKSLRPDEVSRVYDVMREVLQDAVDRSRGLAAGQLKGEKRVGMRVHGRAGQACPVCGDTVAEVSFADRAMQYCPTCQTDGKPLADRRMSRLLK